MLHDQDSRFYLHCGIRDAQAAAVHAWQLNGPARMPKSMKQVLFQRNSVQYQPSCTIYHETPDKLNQTKRLFHQLFCSACPCRSHTQHAAVGAEVLSCDTALLGSRNHHQVLWKQCLSCSRVRTADSPSTDHQQQL